jgi:hypothetical protein
VIATLHTTGQQIMFNYPTHVTYFDKMRYDIPNRKQLLSSKFNLRLIVLLLPNKTISDFLIFSPKRAFM